MIRTSREHLLTMSPGDDTNGFPTDYEIAEAADKQHISDVVESIGLGSGDLDLYGEHKAKVKIDAIRRIREEHDRDANLVLEIGRASCRERV